MQHPTPAPAQSAACPVDLKPGERYAGAIVNPDGSLSHHLVLLADEPSGRLDWHAALAWAASIQADLPSRREQSLLCANLKDKFGEAWYWSNERTKDGAYAWGQYFNDGYQDVSRTSYEARVRAVRRIAA